MAPRLRALLWDDTDAAASYLAAAQEEGVRFEEARARLVLGSLDVDPREHLTTAYRSFDALGADPGAAAPRTRCGPAESPSRDRPSARAECSPTWRPNSSGWCATA